MSWRLLHVAGAWRIDWSDADFVCSCLKFSCRLRGKKTMAEFSHLELHIYTRYLYSAEHSNLVISLPGTPWSGPRCLYRWLAGLGQRKESSWSGRDSLFAKPPAARPIYQTCLRNHHEKWCDLYLFVSETLTCPSAKQLIFCFESSSHTRRLVLTPCYNTFMHVLE